MSGVLGGDAEAIGVTHGAVLVEFGEAMLRGDARRRARARQAVHNALGAEGLVDAAAIVASFNSVVIIADSTGIPLEDFKAEATVDLRSELGLEKLNHLES